MKLKLTLLVLAFLFTINFAKAQNWAGGIDDDRFNWGYSFQYISAEYKIWKNPNWRTPFPDSSTGLPLTDSLNSISSNPTPGFAIGFVGNKKINNNLDLRFTPSLVFSDRKINYTTLRRIPDVEMKVIEKKISATLIDLPLSLKLKSDRLMNFRAYMLGGLKYSIGINKRKDDAAVPDDQKEINNRKSFLSYEAGAGMDFYFGFFKMSTELKISQSFKNIILHESTAFASPIDKAKLRHFTFSLFFE